MENLVAFGSASGAALWRRPGVWGVAGAAVAVSAAAVFWTDTAPYPYAQRMLLDLPLPFLTRRRLDVLLDPRQGERVLEIGPGTGLQSLHVAPQLGMDGQLDIVDIQQEMLDHVMRRGAADLDDLGDSGRCSRPAVRGCELRRRVHGDRSRRDTGHRRHAARGATVLKLTGRLVVGEFLDRHHVPLSTLTVNANPAGLHLAGHLGPPLAYYALLRPCQ